MKALLIVDVQNDFCPGGALPVWGGDAIIPVVNCLSHAFDLVIATQDWHPADHSSFAANHVGGTVGDVVDLDGVPQILWPAHCAQNSPGADFHPTLDRAPIRKVFRKGVNPRIDSYSAFYDNAHRRNTGLARYLRERAVTDVYICGLATDYCVLFSALDALGEGFRTYVVRDACRGVELRPGDVNAALDTMKSNGALLITSDEVFRTVDAAARPV